MLSGRLSSNVVLPSMLIRCLVGQGTVDEHINALRDR